MKAPRYTTSVSKFSLKPKMNIQTPYNKLAITALMVAFVSILGVQSRIEDKEESQTDKINRSKRSDDTAPLEDVVSQQAAKLSAMEAELQTLRTQLSTLQTSKGSTFVRWGRSSCPDGTEMLYTGVAGGSPHSESGGAANRICLTTEPVFDGMSVDTALGRLTGVQYYIPGHHHTDVLCAVCYTTHAATFMVPGTNKCPAGTVAQYSGYLTSTHYGNAATAEFLCLDGTPEDRMGSEAQDSRAAYIEHAVTVCGSLPCPPYVNGKVATCVVCSK